MFFKYSTVLLILFILTATFCIKAQNKDIKELSLLIDHKIFEYSTDTVNLDGEAHFAFQYTVPNETAEVRLYPNDSLLNKFDIVRIVPSADFTFLDSLVLINGHYYRTKLKFNDLNNIYRPHLTFMFKNTANGKTLYKEYSLLPYCETKTTFISDNEELYIGEEKVFEIQSNLAGNIIVDNVWKETLNFDYRVSEQNSLLYLHIMPKELGEQLFEIKFHTKKPYISQDGNIIYDLPFFSKQYKVKSPRLSFLNVNIKEFMLIQPGHDNYEVIIEGSKYLKVHKTYRIEDRETIGTPLVGEFFTKEYLSYNRVLCDLRLYRLHNSTSGYLYIKDGDEAQYVTNFNVIPKTSIKKLSILRKGAEWTTSLDIYPGEDFELKIEGESLQKAQLVLEELPPYSIDSLYNNDKIIRAKYKVPIDIHKKKIQLLNAGNETGWDLNLSEYKHAKEFDFISLNTVDKQIVLTDTRKTIRYDHVLEDLIVQFDEDKIDANNYLYGTQFIEMEIKISDKTGNLIELKSFNDLEVCPGTSSPRYEYYNRRNCIKEISLNDRMNKKTFDLPEWSKIEMTIKHKQSQYKQKSERKDIELYLQRYRSFDIELSFPAGLITVSKRVEKDAAGNITKNEIAMKGFPGISLAMMVQASFYHPEKIARYRPYKIGAGFLAFNAFDFSKDNDRRDFGIVLLGSLYPSTKERKLTFPLYVGGGYFLTTQKWFGVIDPGIRVSF